MMIRKRRKYRKYLGHRTHHGDTKNRRGAGVRGGRGRAGAWDHKKKTYMPPPKKGFRNPTTRKLKEITTARLNTLVERGVAEKEGEVYVLHLEDHVLLSKGEVKYPIRVYVARATERAVERVKRAGGEVVYDREA